MIRNMTLGQYYPVNTVIHALDARVKVVSAFVYIISLFIVNDFKGLLLGFLFLFICIFISKVPVRLIFRSVKPIVPLVTITFLFNLFLSKGTILAKFWIFEITDEGVYHSVYMASRLLLLVVVSSLLTLTTNPVNISDGVEKLLSPFKKIGLPAHEIAMMMMIALRFIPTLMEESDKIIKAQKARGADFENGFVIARAKALVPIVIPLFISAFRIAADLAMAMEARCYKGGEGRTKMKPLILGSNDLVSILVMIIFIVAMITERVIF